MIFGSTDAFVTLAIGIAIVIILLTRGGSPKLGFMLAFAVLGLIIPSIIALLIFGASPLRRMPYGRNSRSTIEFLFFVGRVCNFVGAMFLIPLAWNISGVTKGPVGDFPVANRDRLRELILPHMQWKAKDLSAAAKHSILRRREWAFLIDHVPLFVYALWRGSHSAMGIEDLPFSRFSIAILAAVSIFWWIFYIPAKDALAGVSIGKAFTGCRVVDYDTGAPIDFPRSILRNFLFLIPGFALVECAVALTRSDRRRLGDLMANTTVVKGEPAFVDGVEVPQEAVVMEAPMKHPLDP